jgi:hypothetical protein
LKKHLNNKYNLDCHGVPRKDTQKEILSCVITSKA